jgi:tetratricopeptide (TPR) repeat protein
MDWKIILQKTNRLNLSFLWFIFCVVSVCVNAHAQEKTTEFRPKLAEPDQQKSARKVDVGPAGPRINSSDMLRRAKESKIQTQSLSIERKLISLIQRTPDEDPKKPLILDRLAKFYWKLAGDAQNSAYLKEEKCFEASKKQDDDIDRCADLRISELRKAEDVRAKAIEVYSHIVRNFPNFDDLDQILFALGFNFQQKQQYEDAKKIYTELIQRYPDSPMLADAIFSLADIYFATGDVTNAGQLYSHVIKNFPKASVYPYSVYKLGWCFYNQTDYQGALNQFIKVIKLQNKIRKGSRLGLKKEAQRDMVRVYVNIANATASGGLKLIKKYAPKRVDKLAENLADLYAGTGQFGKSTTVLKKLIAKNPKSYRVVGYQVRISENLSNTNSPKEAIRSLKRLVSLWQSVRNAKDAEPRRVKQDRRDIERQLNSLARRYHNQALETKSVADFNTALELYETYLNTFPTEPSTYEMAFYYAEILFRLEKWNKAAETYEKVLTLNPQGDFTKDSAHGFYICYRNLLKTDLDRASTDQIGKEDTQRFKVQKSSKKGKKGKKGDQEDKAQYPRKDLPPIYTKYLEASELYRKYVKESKYLVDIQYEEARVYYIFNHFDRAVPLFRDISERLPQHRLAVYSANLLLECFNRMGDFDGLAAQVNTFVPLYPSSLNAEFALRLKTLNSELDFKKCELTGNRGENKKAARCFEKYVQKFSQSKIVDKAYANAAAYYQREKMIEKALRVRVRLINDLPNSDLTQDTVYLVAQNLQALAIYSQAAKFYEYFSSKYPNSENTGEALRLASQFRLGLGELDSATKNLKEYIKHLKGKRGRKKEDRKQAMIAYFELGSVLGKRQQWSKMINHYRSFAKRFKGVDIGYLIRSYTLTGNAYMKLPKRLKDKRKARKSYAQAVKAYRSIKADQRQELPLEARSAAAEAMFKITNFDFEELRNNKKKITKVRRTRNTKKHLNMVRNNIKNLATSIKKIRKNYENVVGLNVESWGLAALSQIGQMYYFFFIALEEAPPPPSFDYETKELFRSTMIQQANPLRLKAIEAYKLCLDKSRELQWFNEWSDLAEQQIAKINPAEFSYSIEERGQPSHFHQTRIFKALVRELPSEEDE